MYQLRYLTPKQIVYQLLSVLIIFNAIGKIAKSVFLFCLVFQNLDYYENQPLVYSYILLNSSDYMKDHIFKLPRKN